MRVGFSIRVRYVIGLSALASIIVASYFVLQHTIQKQANYSEVIRIAGDQVGLTHRVAFFVSQMRDSGTEEDFETARSQMRRALNLMNHQHELLKQGDPDRGLPMIMTPLLERLYYDPNFGLDLATKRFMAHARSYQEREYSAREGGSSHYIYVTNFGPYVLETLQSEAVREYERFTKRQIEDLQEKETFAVLIAFLVICLEVLFIFRPLERRVQSAFARLESYALALEQQKKEAEKADHAKSAFVSNMSHELRTPLNAIVGFTDALLQGIYGSFSNEVQKERIAEVNASGKYLLNLVNDLLDLSAIEANKLPLIEEEILSEDIFADIRNQVLSVAERAGVDLHFRSDPEVAGVSWLVDRRRLTQVGINIVSNSIKASQSGSTIEISELSLDDGRFGFQVVDFGRGMTAEEVERAKGRFETSDEGLALFGQRGIGIGLPLSIEIMLLHGGELLIESEKGKGTEVSVLLPKVRRVAKSPQLELIPV